MNRLTLCPATLQQIDELAKYVRSYYEYDALRFDEFVVGAIHELVFDKSLGNAWFIHVNDQRCGYLILTCGFDIEFGGRVGVLTDFFIDDDFRGQGFGKAALDLVEEEALQLGYRGIELSVTHKNSRAQAIYRKCGFEPLEDRSQMIKRFFPARTSD